MNTKQEQVIELLTSDTEVSDAAFNKIAAKYGIHYSDVYHVACCITEGICEYPEGYLHFTKEEMLICYLGLIEEAIKLNSPK